MCLGLGLVGKITGASAKAKRARKQAEREAANDRLMAQAAQQGRESQMAQQKATEAAAALLDRPTEEVEVDVGGTEDELDPATGKRRNTRSSFNVQAPQSGLRI